MRRLVTIASISLFSITLVIAANADSPSSSESAVASALFAEGKSLFDAGKPAEALSKFEASQKIAPSVGALTNIGRCQEKLGRFASAYGAFESALILARDKGDDRVEAIVEQKKTLEPRLSKIRIDTATGIQIKNLRIDGKEMPEGLIGTSFPIDPGNHTIDCDRNGSPFHTELTIKDPGATIFTIPAPTAVVPLPTTSTTTPPPPPPFWNGHRVGAASLGGLALAGIVVGSVYGVSAAKSLDRSQPHCQDLNPDPCDYKGVGLRDLANREAWASNIAFGVGIASIVGGVLLLVTSPSVKAKAKTGQMTWAPLVNVSPTSTTAGAAARF